MPFTPQNDVQYIDAIVPHHEMAIEMAEMVLEKGANAEVRALAQSIRDAQSTEITLLKNARQQLTRSPEIPAPPVDPHQEDIMEHLEAATGTQVDELFLEHMIPHHAEGISIAARALPNLIRQDTTENANDVIATQSQEIGQMQSMLEQGL